MHQKKIRQVIVPKVYSEAIMSLTKRAQKAVGVDGLTLADDSWKYLAKTHLMGIIILSSSSSVKSMSFFLSPVSPASLRGVSIAAGIEELIIFSKRKKR